LGIDFEAVQQRLWMDAQVGCKHAGAAESICRGVMCLVVVPHTHDAELPCHQSSPESSVSHVYEALAGVLHVAKCAGFMHLLNRMVPYVVLHVQFQKLPKQYQHWILTLVTMRLLEGVAQCFMAMHQEGACTRTCGSTMLPWRWVINIKA
jgi:hypothetical protein